jgi:hypothetical protein
VPLPHNHAAAQITSLAPSTGATVTGHNALIVYEPDRYQLLEHAPPVLRWASYKI